MSADTSTPCPVPERPVQADLFIRACQQGKHMINTPRWHPAARPPHGKKPLCGAHKIAWVALGLALLLIAAASVAAWHVWSLQQSGQPMPAWVEWVRGLGLGDRLSRRSGLGVMASVYYTIVVLTFPLGIAVGYGFLTFQPDGALRAWVSQQRDWKGVLACWFCAVFFPVLGAAFLSAAGGGNFRKLKVAGDPMALLVNGWLPFLLIGAVVALGPCMLRAIGAQKH